MLQEFYESFEPDFKAGKLYWKITPRFGRNLLGKQAGSVNHEYRVIKLGQVRVMEHIVLWSMYNGRMPRAGYVIDHKDGNPSNNSIDNLQEILHGDNVWKEKRNYVKGVYKVKTGAFHVRVHGRYIGSRRTFLEAIELLYSSGG